jgi:hypothetical protein
MRVAVGCLAFLTLLMLPVLWTAIDTRDEVCFALLVVIVLHGYIGINAKKNLVYLLVANTAMTIGFIVCWMLLSVSLSNYGDYSYPYNTFRLLPFLLQGTGASLLKIAVIADGCYLARTIKCALPLSLINSPRPLMAASEALAVQTAEPVVKITSTKEGG